MNILVLLKHIEKKIVISNYFKSEDEATHWWTHFPCSEEWRVIHLKKRDSNRHRYELIYSKSDERGILHSKYITCFSKKEAVILEEKVKEANSDYITKIKRIY